MTQICLLDSNRLSSLLKEALPWSDAVSSLMVSAKNGSVLAYAFKANTPSIKDMRTSSTTVTAAYTAATESTLVFESQDTGAISVIAPVADQLLLAVTGSDSDEVDVTQRHLYSQTQRQQPSLVTEAGDETEQSGANWESTKKLEDGKAHIRQELESVSEELAEILREELAGMKWPEDI